jgi:hypothetical protein
VDPDVALAELREAVEELEYRAAVDRAEGQTVKLAAIGRDVAERVKALDTWLTNGGFLPEAWDVERPPAIVGSTLGGSVIQLGRVTGDVRL